LQSSAEPEKGAGLAMGLAYAGGEGVTAVFMEVMAGAAGGGLVYSAKLVH